MTETKDDRYYFDDSMTVYRGKPKQNHTHYLNDKPLYGTSTVLKCLHKELSWWASARAVETLGWIHKMYPQTKRKVPLEERLEKATAMLTVIKDMSAEEYLDLLDLAYKAHSQKLEDAAVDGTDMHFELEQYVKRCMSLGGVPTLITDERECPFDAVRLFSQWAFENVKHFIASEAYCYSKEMWTGGIVDLVYRDIDNKLCLLDFKSAKEAYDNHFFQNAGYDIAIKENGIFTKDGEFVMAVEGEFEKYAVFPFGMLEPEPQFREDVDLCKKAFRHCVGLYQLLSPDKF